MATGNVGLASDEYREPPKIRVWVLYTVWSFYDGGIFSEAYCRPVRQGSFTVEVPYLEYLTEQEFHKLLLMKSEIKSVQDELVTIQQVLPY